MSIPVSCWSTSVGRGPTAHTWQGAPNQAPSLSTIRKHLTCSDIILFEFCPVLPQENRKKSRSPQLSINICHLTTAHEIAARHLCWPPSISLRVAGTPERWSWPPAMTHFWVDLPHLPTQNLKRLEMVGTWIAIVFWKLLKTWLANGSHLKPPQNQNVPPTL